ncbi:hypothetical protein [Microcoleus sp.]|uniref:hypothetical protein n=1 Tax=Microcoleus sp. TaxID=44472 RepID=UPI0035940262
MRFYQFLLPFESLTIPTNLTYSEVWQKLDKIIDPPQTFSMALQFQKSHKPYQGRLSGNTFQIRRTISFYSRNSFLPQITGEISPQPFGCSLKLRMNLHQAVMVFMIVWMSVPASMGLLSLLVWLVDRSVGLIFLPLLGMCIFTWFLSLICFKIEAIKDIKFFSDKFS